MVPLLVVKKVAGKVVEKVLMTVGKKVVETAVMTVAQMVRLLAEKRVVLSVVKMVLQ